MALVQKHAILYNDQATYIRETKSSNIDRIGGRQLYLFFWRLRFLIVVTSGERLSLIPAAYETLDGIYYHSPTY